jgi:hypothetical protein
VALPSLERIEDRTSRRYFEFLCLNRSSQPRPCYQCLVSEDLGFLCLLNKELDGDTQIEKQQQSFIEREGKYRQEDTLQERMMGVLWLHGTEALIFIQRAIYKL